MTNYTIAKQIAESFFSTEHEAGRVADLHDTIEKVLNKKDEFLSVREDAETFFRSAMLNLVRANPVPRDSILADHSYAVWVMGKAVDLTAEMLSSLNRLQEFTKDEKPDDQRPEVD